MGQRAALLGGLTALCAAGTAAPAVAYELQAGVDPLAGDRLGRLALSYEGLVTRDRWIAGVMKSHSIPFASALGGGYGEDALEVSRRHVASILALGQAVAGRALQV